MITLVREALSAHNILRDLGFPAKDISLVQNKEGNIMMLFKAYGEELAINLGDPSPYTFEKLIDLWPTYLVAWYSDQVDGKENIFKQSKCYKSRNQIQRNIKEKTSRTVGPEMLN